MLEAAILIGLLVAPQLLVFAYVLREERKDHEAAMEYYSKKIERAGNPNGKRVGR